MRYTEDYKKVEELKIAYVGGGSRGWAWGLMSDLATAEDISGEVCLYDIDVEAARTNEIIGNKIKDLPDCKSVWNYRATATLEEALTGADFVVISILPGTFDEMESDVHWPEKYGIYQPVGDTVGPGGLIRALRTVPMFEVIGRAIRDCCPKAWVINYTNPMAVCVRTLYRVFPEIKAFGCCHEVFGTQSMLCTVLEEELSIKAQRSEIKINVLGVNHFTWITEAQYKNIDLFPLYAKFCDKHAESGYVKVKDDNWYNSMFKTAWNIKMKLFQRYGVIAAAGDRHLVEFVEGKWFLDSQETIDANNFALTPVSFRKNQLQERLAYSVRLAGGEDTFRIRLTGEEGVCQMRALLGLDEFVTNVNIPNCGQIPNLPMGAVVETNARFCADSVTPLFAGEVPMSVYSLVTRIVGEEETIVEAALTRDLELAFRAFVNDALVTVPYDQARKMFNEMVANTRAYLTDYPTLCKEKE